jgi:hypothetical protein
MATTTVFSARPCGKINKCLEAWTMMKPNCICMAIRWSLKKLITFFMHMGISRWPPIQDF